MKNKLLIFLFLFILGIVNTSSKEYFFYDHGKKVTMEIDNTYISVTFAHNTSASRTSNILERSIGRNINKKSEFAPGSSTSTYVMVKLNESLGQNSLAEIKSNLYKNREVVNVGMCFPGRGKMKHYTTNEIVVKFKTGVSSSAIETAGRFYNAQIIEKVKDFDNLYLIALNPAGSDDVFDLSNKFTLLENIVEYSEPNFIREGMLLSEGYEVRPLPLVIPNDSLFPQMWHIRNLGNNIPFNVKGIPGCDMNVVPAWDITTGNPNVLIAIVDTGVDTNHVDLRDNLCDRSLWYDAVDNNQRPYDQYYHGTGVTGCANAIGNNFAGTIGVAFTCKSMPIRVFGPFPGGFTTDLILAKGVNWAWTHGASVINLSWGGGIPTPLISIAIQNAVHYGRNGKGSVVFAGSGNDNIDTLLYPARMPEVIGCGGLSPCNERKSLISCDNVDSLQNWGATYGENLSIVAPCTYIGTTELQIGWCICGNGTSDASPLAAGVGALILSKNINLSADSVKLIIERSAKKVGNYNYGIPKPNGLWNNEMGYGRIDARSALDITPQGPTSINDLVPPIINIFPPESGVFTSNVSFTANIADNNGVSGYGNSPRLYYYTTQNSQLQITTGILTSQNTYRFSFPNLPYSMGAYYYIAAQDDNGNNLTYPVGGRGANPPGFVRPPRMMFLRNTQKYDTNYTATDVPIPISTQIETTIVSTLHNSISKTVLDVDCWLNINHTYDADISMSLTSPSGTEIVLTGGTGFDGHNYVNTYFDDEATNPIDDSGNHAPFTGHFRPVDRLWFFDGENSAGDWKLKVIDNGRSDGGALVSWGMKITYSTIADYPTIPIKFALVGNYPNPFNPKTRILFNVPYDANVKIVLYDLTGREVKTILNERRGPALQDFVDFDANTVNGTGIASGVYFYSLIGDGKFIESKKMVLVK